MNEVLRLKVAFETIKQSKEDPIQFLSNMELFFCNFALNFKISFSDIKLHKCKSMYKYDNNVFKAVFSVFNFGLEVQSFFKSRASSDSIPLAGYLKQLQNAILKFLEAFLHKTGKRMEIIIRNCHNLDHYLKNSLKKKSFNQVEMTIIKKNLLLMTLDLYFFDRFVAILLNQDPDLFETFKEPLILLFQSVLSIFCKERLRIPKQVFFVLRLFFRTYIVFFERDWNTFVSVFCDFVDLITFFETKSDFGVNLDPFIQIRGHMELDDIVLHGETQNMLSPSQQDNAPLLCFKSESFKHFFEKNFIKPNSGIIFSILKEAYKFKGKCAKQAHVSLERFTNSFFLLIEKFIFRFLDEESFVRLNQLMLFLKFLCDQVTEDNLQFQASFLISNKNNKKISSILKNISLHSDKKIHSRKISEKHESVETLALTRKRNKTEIRAVRRHISSHDSSPEVSRDSDSLAQCRTRQ